jgi:hypothetical protein
MKDALNIGLTLRVLIERLRLESFMKVYHIREVFQSIN